MMNFVPWNPPILPPDDTFAFPTPNIWPPLPAPLASISSARGRAAGRNHRKPRRSFHNQWNTKKRSWRTKNAPFAPRNTTSFWMRSNKSGGITSLVSPSPLTPAVLPTPTFSPAREGLSDLARERWGVDGYGSMKGLIRLRQGEIVGESREEMMEEGGSSSDSDLEEHVEVERRLDHDLSRFEMVGCLKFQANCDLENRVDDQEMHVMRLKEENFVLKERVFSMERQMREIRWRMMVLETEYQARAEERSVSTMEEVVDNEESCMKQIVAN